MAKYVIIGGVAGGATTAARLRRNDEFSEIIMLEKGEHISYANCGLPYYIGDVITEREKLLVQTPESFSARFHIDVRVFSEVLSIDSKKKVIQVKELQSGKTYEESYDKLVLSPGAKPLKFPIDGIDLPNIFTLRNVADTDKIKQYVDEQLPYSAVVIGGGFIGLEMAENLHRQGIKVTLVEAAPQVMNMMDPEMAALIHQQFKENEVALYLNDRVTQFMKRNEALTIVLHSGKEIDADFVIFSAGVKPDVEVSRTAGVAIGEHGGIVVNEFLQTSEKDIYAVGDSIEFDHPITHQKSIAYLAGPANKQGRILADNLVYGHKKKYSGSIGTAIAQVFDVTAAVTGLSDKQLKAAGLAFESTIINGSSHAGYYPDAMPMTLKISFHPETGLVYGGQVVGISGIDKRIDMIATVIKKNGTIYDLQEIEHAYAPPFSSAKDPVNQIGFNAENIIQGLFKPLSPYEMHDRDHGKTFLLDIRTEDECALGTLPGAVNIPLDDMRERYHEIPKDKPVYIYCGVGLRGYVAARILAQHGYDVYNLSGGLKVYQAATQEQNYEIAFKPQLIERDKNMQAKDTGSGKNIVVDACGLQCPGPILRLKKEIDLIEVGDRIEQTASDPGFFKDVASWCNVTGNTLIDVKKEGGKITAIVEKAAPADENEAQTDPRPRLNHKTIVVFSDDLDKALASFVIANGAASMGREVTLFFTFWGLNVVKKAKKPRVKKDLMGRMFGFMMASDSRKLKLSKMNMANMGRMMMRYRMKSKKVDSLEEMIGQAKAAGVKIIACQMSMDVMGVSYEELQDGVEIGGVANYLEAAEKSNLNLFV